MTAPDTAAKHRILRLATYASVATAALLIVVKLFAWLLTGSVSVLASLVDSLMDAAASLINLLAVHWSLKPADEEHRFGHGKAEALAGLGQAAFIAGSAVFLMLQAVDRIVHPKPLESLAVGLGVMAFAIVATGLLLLVQRRAIRLTGSTAIRADALHYATDLLTNASIVLALLLAWFGWSGFDPWFALAIAAYILHSAWQIGRDAVDMLMDREVAAEVQRHIESIALERAGVRGVHGLRTRQSGQDLFIQLHLDLDADLPLVKAHAIGQGVEDAIRRAYPHADVLIHQDPVGV